MTLLGLLSPFHRKGNNFHLAISLTPEKRERWHSLIRPYLAKGDLSHSCTGKLIGRLSFSQTAIFGKFDRAQLRPLYTKLYRRVYNSRLPQLERDSLRWWDEVASEFAPRLAIPRSARADWLIYTDAATEPTTICALIPHGNSSSPQLDTCYDQRLSAARGYLFRHTALIYGMELLSLVAFFETHSPRLRGGCCWVYLDNNNCLADLTRGDSNTDTIAVIVARFLEDGSSI